MSDRLSDEEIAEWLEWVPTALRGALFVQHQFTQRAHALVTELRAHRAASGGGVSCVQCAQNDDCPGFDACPWLPRGEGEDDVAGALRDLLLSADCTWESNNGGHDWREACEAARAALALHRSGGGDAREAGRREGLEQAARALRHDPSVLASMNLEQIRDEVRSLPERVLALRAPSPDTGERGSTGNEGRE